MLKVIKYSSSDTIPYSGKKPYTCTENFHWLVEANIDNVHGYLHFWVSPGHKVDGASVPWPINKIDAFRNWYTDKKGNATKKNLAGVGHDILYMFSGEIIGLDRKLTVEECDDYYRGMKREDGFGRFAASAQDFFLQLAHNKRHWGNDGFNVKEFATVMWMPDLEV